MSADLMTEVNCSCLIFTGGAFIGVASYGARAPPLDFQLVILGITRFRDSDESCARFSVRAFSGHEFCRGKFKLCHFLPTVFLRE